MIGRLLHSLRSLTATRPGYAGEPGSANGASSFHAWWQIEAPGPFVEATVVLEILDRPSVERLYFWALQVAFLGGGSGGPSDGGHLGLQYHPGFPQRGAVNWGGYSADGAVLRGGPSPLSSARGDPNTRDYPWRPGVPYRLRIFRSPEPGPGEHTAWRGEVLDLDTAERTIVRDLYARGAYLGSPVMWTEAFARCEHPPVTVRWSEPVLTTVEGDAVPVGAFRLNYQSVADGGCSNTASWVEWRALYQRTASERRYPTGSVLRFD